MFYKRDILILIVKDREKLKELIQNMSSVEELMDYSSLASEIRMLVDVRKRRPMWNI